MKKVVCLLLFFGVVFGVTARDQVPFKTPMQAARYERLTHQFRCLVCQNEDLAASDATLARELKTLLAEQVRAGNSDAVITEFMVRRYGQFVLLKPSFMPSTWFLWLFPIICLLIGFGVWWKRVRASAAVESE